MDQGSRLLGTPIMTKFNYSSTFDGGKVEGYLNL